MLPPHLLLEKPFDDFSLLLEQRSQSFTKTWRSWTITPHLLPWGLISLPSSACRLTKLHPDCSPSIHTVPSVWDALFVPATPSFPICLLLTSSNVHARIAASEQPYLSSLTASSAAVRSWHDTTHFPFTALNLGNHFPTVSVFMSSSLFSGLEHTFHNVGPDHVCFCSLESSLFTKIPGTYLALSKEIWNKSRTMKGNEVGCWKKGKQYMSEQMAMVFTSIS